MALGGTSPKCLIPLGTSLQFAPIFAGSVRHSAGVASLAVLTMPPQETTPMAADSLTDPSTLTRALPAPTTSTLATLDAAILAPAELAAALRFAEAAKAANTRRAYAADWADFCQWAAARAASPLPCPPGLLCGYLAALADAGRRASTITRRAAAIAHQHRAARRGTAPASKMAMTNLPDGPGGTWGRSQNTTPPARFPPPRTAGTQRCGPAGRAWR